MTRKEVKSQKVLVAHLLQGLMHCCEEVVFFSVQKLGGGGGGEGKPLKGFERGVSPDLVVEDHFGCCPEMSV